MPFRLNAGGRLAEFPLLKRRLRSGNIFIRIFRSHQSGRTLKTMSGQPEELSFHRYIRTSRRPPCARCAIGKTRLFTNC
jgi:hypothetical protein